MNWLLIAIVILAVIILLQMSHFRHKITTIIVIVMLLFLYISFAVVAKNNDADLSTAKGVFQASRVYFLWMGQTFGNLRSITGAAIGMDWLPENKTIQDMDPRVVMKG